MELNEYQRRAMWTCMASCDNFSYMFLNLVGEVGEFASKVAKAIRKDMKHINHNYFVRKCEYDTIEEAVKAQDDLDRLNEELKKEAGDILWQLSGLCDEMGWTLEDVAQTNLRKLAERKVNGTIDGNGDGVTKEERSK